VFINYNGKIIPENTAFLSTQNEAIRGNIVHQKFLVSNSKIFFAEESYFNLMASMRKIRLQIPLEFTLEFFENQINNLLFENKLTDASICIDVFSTVKKTEFVIHSKKLQHENGIISAIHSIDIFKEILIFPTFLNSQPINHIENVVAQKYAEDNDLNDVIFLTNDKKISRTIKGNIYFILDKKIVSLPQKDGIYKQAFDYEFLNFIKNNSDFQLDIQSLSPFETQKMEEIFIIEEGNGIHCISKIRQKNFGNEKTKQLLKDFIQNIK